LFVFLSTFFYPPPCRHLVRALCGGAAH
jgi:hypothetical protein